MCSVALTALQLEEAIALVDRHPEQVFVVDHLAKPRIRELVTEPWARLMRELARRPNVHCKVSGMVTEADPSTWTDAQLRPYFDTVLDAFGAERLMFGSDWPVCLLGAGFGRWRGVVTDWCGALSAGERSEVAGGDGAAGLRSARVGRQPPVASWRRGPGRLPQVAGMNAVDYANIA
ncbi:MAG TPA: amidohydrolase family protein [Opitutaceae bacterium]